MSGRTIVLLASMLAGLAPVAGRAADLASPVEKAPAPGRSRAKDSRPVLALLSVRVGTGFSDREGSFVEDLLLSALDQTGRFQVVGHSDIQTMLDLEARKQITGCNDDTGCMTAIAGALGADYVASAGVGRLGTATLLTFKVIDARAARVLLHTQKTVQLDAELIGAGTEIANQVVAAIFGAPPPGDPSPSRVTLLLAATAPPPGVVGGEGAQPATHPMSLGRRLGIAAIVAGGLALVGATALRVVANGDAAAAKTNVSSAGLSATQEVSAINQLAIAADSLFGVGGVLAVAGLGVTVAF